MLASDVEVVVPSVVVVTAPISVLSEVSILDAVVEVPTPVDVDDVSVPQEGASP